MQAHPKSGRIPALWDGMAAQRCLAVLRNYFHADQPALAHAGSNN
jgi:hypothetical protein